MSRRVAAAIVLLGCVAWSAQAVVACVSLPEPGVGPTDASSDGSLSDGGAIGVACGSGNECATGFCVDGVCCESKCDGVCEKCNLPSTEGKCAPVPDGQDPDNDCPSAPLPDAGLLTPSDAGASVDGGEAGAGSTPIKIPDGGVRLDDGPCAGKCNGKRACAYPSASTGCGGAFCNTSTQQGRSACDGKGRCGLSLESCIGYACPDGDDGGVQAAGCLKSCTGPSDCLETHYCDGNGNRCQARLANGATCSTDVQCQSGYCVSGVCCNDSCNGYPGATCTQLGSVGTCRCSACATGPCQLWYPDKDGDGAGDMSAVYGPIIGTNAIPGCVKGPDGGPPSPPQPGYVLDHTDCYDVNDALGVLVHKGQKNYFATGYGPLNANFDYDCSGSTEKETTETPGKKCGVCGGIFPTCTKAELCKDFDVATGARGWHDCPPVAIPSPGCSAAIAGAFEVNVACGADGAFHTCGTCLAGGAPPSDAVSTVKQRCH